MGAQYQISVIYISIHNSSIRKVESHCLRVILTFKKEGVGKVRQYGHNCFFCIPVSLPIYTLGLRRAREQENQKKAELCNSKGKVGKLQGRGGVGVGAEIVSQHSLHPGK